MRRLASLRVKLVVAGAAVLAVVLVSTAVASSRWLHHSLSRQADAQAAQLVALVGHAVAAPLAQRDEATLQQILDQARSTPTVAYLVLWDHRGRVLASSGWPQDQPLPPRDRDGVDLDRADGVAHLGAPVVVAGQRLGRLDLGLSTVELRAERQDMLQRQLLTAAGALAAAVLLLGGVAAAITRHLAGLSQAARHMAAGHLAVTVPVTTRDEVGQLAEAFNHMARTLAARMDAERAEKARLSTLLGALDHGILFVDGRSGVAWVNAAFEQLWGLEPGTSHTLDSVVAAMRARLGPAHAARADALRQPGLELGEEELHLLDGRVLTQAARRIEAPGEAPGTIWLQRDVTAERNNQRRADQALIDPLTRLHNRRGLFERLPGLLADGVARGRPLALMFIDLDDFKRANDIGGHRTGDDVLVAVARALSDACGNDALLARPGGDEFAVACPGLDASAAGALAERLIQAVAALRFVAAGQTLRVGCSVGVALHPQHGGTADELVARADQAMYRAKTAGKNDWVLHGGEPEPVGRARVDWAGRLQQALREGGLLLHHQPVLRAGDRGVAWHEALLRMVDPDDPAQCVSPAPLVAAAEQSGHIRQLDRWVFETTLRLLAALPEGAEVLAKLSARSLLDPGFHEFLAARLQRHDVDPRRLRIELADGAATVGAPGGGIGDAEAAVRAVTALRSLGCAIHLAHVGAGFNAYAQLRRLPVDVVKIDGRFVRDLAIDEGHRLFVKSAVDIAHHLGRLVVAEHVEDEPTAALLRRLGVDMLQGFHLGRPQAQPPSTVPASRLRLVNAYRPTDFG